MQNLPVGFQVSLELTKIVPVRQAIVFLALYSGKQILDLARNLRNSNSDILVEADLVAIFGRVWIDETITRDFKAEVIKNTEVVSIGNVSLELRKGAGPTLEHALQERSDTGALSTIIQLSLLSATHDRQNLASALSYGLNKRVELDYPNANPSPGYDGILGTLEAISSQSPGQFWSSYAQLVRERVTPVLGHSRARLDAIALPTNLLFACLDSLCMIQRWPEEYTLTVSNAPGCITLIIWAHHLLGLPVVLRGERPDDDIYSRHDISISPRIIIQGSRIYSSKGPEICLLGRDNQVCLRIDPNLAEFVPIEARERIPLAGYSTTHLCRHHEMSSTWSKTQEFEDAAHLSVAIALSFSGRLLRSTTNIPISIKKWQIWDAVSVLFDGIDFDQNRAEKYAAMILPHLALKESFPTIIPPALKGMYVREDRGHHIVCDVAVDILTMATIPGIKDYGKLPLIAEQNFDEQGYLMEKFSRGKSTVPLGSADIFNHRPGR
jgi:hypothetical protein